MQGSTGRRAYRSHRALRLLCRTMLERGKAFSAHAGRHCLRRRLRPMNKGLSAVACRWRGCLESAYLDVRLRNRLSNLLSMVDSADCSVTDRCSGFKCADLDIGQGHRLGNLFRCARVCNIGNNSIANRCGVLMFQRTDLDVSLRDGLRYLLRTPRVRHFSNCSFVSCRASRQLADLDVRLTNRLRNLLRLLRMWQMVGNLVAGMTNGVRDGIERMKTTAFTLSTTFTN